MTRALMNTIYRTTDAVDPRGENPHPIGLLPLDGDNGASVLAMRVRSTTFADLLKWDVEKDILPSISLDWRNQGPVLIARVGIDLGGRAEFRDVKLDIRDNQNIAAAIRLLSERCLIICAISDQAGEQKLYGVLVEVGDSYDEALKATCDAALRELRHERTRLDD